MDDMRQILLTHGKEAWRKAMMERKRAREEADHNDPMRETKAALTARIMGCPLFLMYAIGPIPNFLQGKVPVDGLAERVANAQQRIDSAAPEDSAILDESYAQEVAIVAVMTDAFEGRDLTDAAQAEAIRQAVQQALEAYMAQPPMERKHYLLR